MLEMSKKEKLISKLLNKNSSFTFDELESLLGSLGYEVQKTGKTAGSRRTYYNQTLDHLIRIHKPHPSNELKKYIKELIIKELKDKEII
jgi:hypothetical protein